MNAAETVTVTCPHCTNPLRALTQHAGKQVRCPNPTCLQPVAVPFTLDDEDEPDEPVLIPEDQADALPITPSVPAQARAPKPRRKHRRVEDDEDEPKTPTPVWPWALAGAGGLLLACASVGLGWMLLRTSDKPTDTTESGTTFAALESRKPEPKSKPDAPKPGIEPKSQKDSEAPKRPDPVDDPPPRPPARPVPAPELNVPNDPDPPVKLDVNAAAFVGKWEMAEPLLKQAGIDVSMEFRADGTCLATIRGAGQNEQKKGTWKWDGKKLHVEVDGGAKEKPSEIKWNGPDEFVVVTEAMPVTLRRVGKAPRP